MANMSIRLKILLVLLLVGLGCLGLGSIMGYVTGSKALREAVEERLIGQRETKRLRVESYLVTERRLANIIAHSPTVAEAANALIAGFHQQPDPPTEDEMNALRDWYAKTMFPAYEKVAETHPDFDAVIPQGDMARRLQIDYIVKNPNPPYEKYKLNSAGESSYDAAHKKYNVRLRALEQAGGFFDLMIADAATGDVVYAVEKEPDFATNAYNGPYSKEVLGRVVAKAQDPRRGGGAVIEDFSPYPASKLAPQMFIAVPLSQEGRIFATVLFQVDITRLNKLLNDDGNWTSTGQGETGEVILVGQDRLMRSQSREMAERPQTFFEHLRQNSVSDELMRQIRAVGTTILYLPSNSVAVQKAFHGESGVETLTDYRGVDVIEAYAPVRTDDVQWMIAAKQDAAEAFAPLDRYRRDLRALGALASIGLSLLSLLWAWSVLAPMRRILAAMRKVRGGDLTVRVPAKGNDEFGEIARGYNEIVDLVSEKDAKLADAAREKGELLAAMYPSSLAQRIGLGATLTVETASNVTVSVVFFDGLEALGIEYGATEMRDRLDQLFAVLRGTAQTCGVEPVRSLGESYVAVCGLSAPRIDHAARAFSWAQAAAAGVQRLAAEWSRPVTMRAGLASGDIHIGKIASSHSPFDVWGPTLTLARIMVLEAEPGEIRVAESTFTLLPDTDGLSANPVLEIPVAGSVKSWTSSVNLRPALAAD